MSSKRDKAWRPSGYKCGWCGDEIPEDTELFSISAKARPDFDISEFRGKVIDVFLSQRNRTDFAALKNLVPASQILFGTDYPFIPMTTTADGLAKLALRQVIKKRSDAETQ